jgi:hypothetical protein
MPKVKIGLIEIMFVMNSKLIPDSCRIANCCARVAAINSVGWLDLLTLRAFRGEIQPAFMSRS